MNCQNILTSQNILVFLKILSTVRIVPIVQTIRIVRAIRVIRRNSNCVRVRNNSENSRTGSAGDPTLELCAILTQFDELMDFRENTDNLKVRKKIDCSGCLAAV